MAVTNLSTGSGVGGVGTSLLSFVAQFTLNTTNEAAAYNLTNANSPAYVESKWLARGANDIVPPTKASGLIIIPSSYAMGTQQLTLTDAAGDAACVLALNAPTILSFQSTPPGHIYLDWDGAGYNALAVTATNATDVINSTAHYLADGNVVYFTATTMPSGLTSRQLYYVVSKATDTFKVATSAGGTPIDFTSDGTSLKVYEHASDIKLVWL